jgi:hypothetical protein
VSIAAISSLAIAGESFILVCNVSSAREANLSWVDPNGVERRDDPDTAVFYSGWNGEMSTLVLEINSIRTSESGVYKCISDIAVPPSISEASFVVQVQSKSGRENLKSIVSYKRTMLIICST